MQSNNGPTTKEAPETTAEERLLGSNAVIRRYFGIPRIAHPKFSNTTYTNGAVRTIKRFSLYNANTNPKVITRTPKIPFHKDSNRLYTKGASLKKL